MSSRRVRHLVSNAVEFVIGSVATATRSAPHRKILIAFAATVVIASVPMLFRPDAPSVAANSTLKCYDRAWKYEPCAPRASVSSSRFTDRTTGVQQPASLIVTALNEQEHWTTPAADPPADAKVSAPAAIDQPENSKTGAPAVRRGITPRKRLASTGCGRRLIGCFFSALRRRVTHLASVAATESGSRSARERYQSKNL
jgi:hypothetical protein